MPKSKTPDIINLDKDTAAAYDRMMKASEAVSKARKHEKTAKQAKAELAEAFGDAKFGRLPDGRVIFRNAKTQNRSAQRAKTVTIVSYELVDEE